MDFKKGLGLFSLVALLSVFSAGCFDTPTEVILASDAVKIPGLPQKYLSYTIIPVPGSNDYRYSKPAEAGENALSGYARALLLKDDIYIVQTRDDNQPTYTIDFYKLVNNGGAVELKSAFPANEFNPENFGVKWEIDDMGMETIYGSRENILAYLRAYAGTSFTVSANPG